MPAVQPVPAVQQQQIARQRAADHAGTCPEGVEYPHRSAAMPGGEPAGHEPGDTREKAGFRDAQGKAHGDETGGVGDEGGAGGADAPDDHGDAEPASCAQSGKDGTGWNLEQHVAPEKRAGGQAVGGGGQTQGLVHGQRGDRHVEAVEGVDHVGKAEKRHEAPGDFTHDGGFDVQCHQWPPIRLFRRLGPSLGRVVAGSPVESGLGIDVAICLRKCGGNGPGCVPGELLNVVDVLIGQSGMTAGGNTAGFNSVIEQGRWVGRDGRR